MSSTKEGKTSRGAAAAVEGSTQNSTASALADGDAPLMLDNGTELREGYAEVGDVTLHYVEAGEGPNIRRSSTDSRS